jgi:hypothetical protein
MGAGKARNPRSLSTAMMLAMVGGMGGAPGQGALSLGIGAATDPGSFSVTGFIAATAGIEAGSGEGKLDEAHLICLDE